MELSYDDSKFSILKKMCVLSLLTDIGEKKKRQQFSDGWQAGRNHAERDDHLSFDHVALAMARTIQVEMRSSPLGVQV